MAGPGKAWHPGVLFLQVVTGLVLAYYYVLQAVLFLCCFVGFPSTEVPVLGIYSAVSRAAHPCPRNSCSAMPPLAGCSGSQCSAICQGGSTASLLFPRGSSLWLDIHRCREEASSCCPGRLGAGLSLPSATLSQHPISNLPLSRALLVATCLLSQETWFLFLSLTSALALQRAWPGSFPGLNWVLSTPSFDACRAARRGHERCNELLHG